MTTVTGVKVVDASALAAVCFDEPAGPATAQLLTDTSLLAPAILHFEMANICWLRIKRDPASSAAFLRQYAVRHDFPISIVDVRFDLVVELALRTSLSAYDASYLWLARHLGVELVTLDTKLSRVARQLH